MVYNVHPKKQWKQVAPYTQKITATFLDFVFWVMSSMENTGLALTAM